MRLFAISLALLLASSPARAQGRCSEGDVERCSGARVERCTSVYGVKRPRWELVRVCERPEVCLVEDQHAICGEPGVRAKLRRAAQRGATIAASIVILASGGLRRMLE